MPTAARRASSRARPLARGRGARVASRLLLGVVVVGLLGAACGTTARPMRPEFDLRDPSATRRLDAVSFVERTGDRSRIPLLIEMLDDDDESVRIAVGATLRGMTGHDTGYRAYATPPERRAQVATWRAWWASASRVGSPVPVAAPGPSAGYTDGGVRARSP